MSLNVVILAAGKGTRMQSDMPKVLHSLAQKSLLQHVLDTAKSLNPKKISIVIGYESEIIKKSILDENVSWRLQEKQLGTGHAVQQAIPDLYHEKTLILYGDVPLIKKSDLEKLINVSDSGIGIMTFIKKDPFGYGRIQRDQNKINAIIEEKDSSEEQKKITEINTGIMSVNTKLLIDWLGRLKNNNAQKEYYLTDIIKFAVRDKVFVSSHIVNNELSITGINSKKDLSFVERGFQLTKAEKLMNEGVTLIDPSRIDIRGELHCGKDVIIDIGCIFEGKVTIGNNVKINPYTVIKDSTIQDNSIIESFSHIDSSKVGSENRIGPYARLRPGSFLSDKIRIGNFVEIKNTSVDLGTKINHLSYIGDSVIGKNVNIGAGTITCNYDGIEKHKTIIDDDVFVGSNTQFIAPVKIGKGATIGAGSTITKDAPKENLTLSRSQQKTISGWVKPEKK